MNKTEREELNKLFLSFIKKFRSRCYICRLPYNTYESWTVHHIEYIPNEKIYSDFRLPNKSLDKLSYYRYLTPIILKNPKRFRLIHNTHHFVLERYWAIYKPDNFERMVKLARDINKRKFKR